MESDGPPALERALLLHLLDHRGHQVRFEADQWTTEFGIFRAFAGRDLGSLKNALRSLETSRLIYRRVQYVIGYSEPKLIYSLTPSGHRKASDLRRGPDDSRPPDGAEESVPPPEGPDALLPPGTPVPGNDPEELAPPPGAAHDV
jgi:DNA-binding PadR family transcriptional regulator